MAAAATPSHEIWHKSSLVRKGTDDSYYSPS